MMKIAGTAHALLALCGPPAVWGTHFLVCYVLVSLACMYGREDAVLPGIAIATTCALALLAMLAWHGFRLLRNVAGDGNDALLARVGLALSAVSAVALSWVAFPAVVLPACAA